MPPRTVASFSADLSKFSALVQQRGDELVQNVAFDLAEKVVKRTPIDVGNARAHWWPSIDGNGAPPLGPTDLASSSGTVAAAAMGPTLAQAKAGDVVTLSNNAPYIERLEHGYSKQAPNGMVAITVAEGPSIVARIAGEMASGGGASRAGEGAA